MPTNERNPDESTTDRYREIEYTSDGGPVLIIQDTANQHAWIQSDRPAKNHP